MYECSGVPTQFYMWAYLPIFDLLPWVQLPSKLLSNLLVHSIPNTFLKHWNQVCLAFDPCSAAGLHGFHLLHPPLACLSLLWQPGKVHGQLSGGDILWAQYLGCTPLDWNFSPPFPNDQCNRSGGAAKGSWRDWTGDWSKVTARRALWDLLRQQVSIRQIHIWWCLKHKLQTKTIRDLRLLLDLLAATTGLAPPLKSDFLFCQVFICCL